MRRQQYLVVLSSFGPDISIASREASMNYEGILSGAALQRVRIVEGGCCEKENCML